MEFEKYLKKHLIDSIFNTVFLAETHGILRSWRSTGTSHFSRKSAAQLFQLSTHPVIDFEDLETWK